MRSKLLFGVSCGLLLVVATTGLAWPDARVAGLIICTAIGLISAALVFLSPGVTTSSETESSRSGVDLADSLSATMSRLTASLEAIGDAVIAVDDQTRVVYTNGAALELLIRTQDEVVGKPLAWALPHQDAISALRAVATAGGEPQVQFIQRPNKHYWKMVAAPIPGGGEWSALAIIHDLTEVKRTEQVRRDFVANVSHELRTPLASIKSVVDTLRASETVERATTEDFLARADAEIDRLVQMVEELLELSRIESGDVPLKTEVIAMAGVLRHAVQRLEPQAHSLGLKLDTELPDHIPDIIGDADRLERAIVNLIQNAIKFTTAGGSIRAVASSENGRLSLRIIDTGEGIDPEDLPRVFERFYKADRARRRGGTGLGLAIVKHTVEAHGGTVVAESQPGHGSTFTISLPTIRSRVPHSP